MNVLAITVLFGLSSFASAAVLNSPAVLPVRVIGPPSELRDDAPSDASCPSGNFIIECRCEDDSVCDGSAIIDERLCRAYHGGVKASPTRAITTCLPSAGYLTSVVTKDVKFGSYLNCPDTYTLMTCSMNNHWSYLRHTHFLRSTAGCSALPSPNAPGRIHTGRKYTGLSILCVKDKNDIAASELE